MTDPSTWSPGRQLLGLPGVPVVGESRSAIEASAK
jgi:hypothetical protein